VLEITQVDSWLSACYSTVRDAHSRGGETIAMCDIAVRGGILERPPGFFVW